MVSTTNDEVEQWLREIEARPRTIQTYRETLKQYLIWANGKPPESGEQAQKFITYLGDLGRSSGTLAVRANALRRYLTWKNIPTRRLEKTSRQLTAPDYLSREEFLRLLAACSNEPLKCLLALLYDTGARLSEILELEHADVNLDGFVQVTRKGGRVEWTPVSDWGIPYLQWLTSKADKSHTRLFGTLNRNWVYSRLRIAVKKSGLDHFHPHMLRHSRAVHLIDQGVDIRDVAYQLGHVNPGTTMSIYTRPQAHDLRKRIPAPDL